ncbi:MAG: GspH/FimT family pseudopilin [Candidatus Azotimanducaceae bacterium WSBS_2022_MAG_OTU7]
MRGLQAGYSTFEVITVLGVSLTLMAFVIPPVNTIFIRSETTSSINRLVAAVNFTRHTAVQYHTIATLCATRPNGTCGASWGGELSVFLDRNRNAKHDPEEKLIARISNNNSGTSVTWRAFQNKQYLQMTPMGYTKFQNGNFVVCPANANPKYARQIVINIQGRVRQNRSTDKAGYPIDRKGQHLRC